MIRGRGAVRWAPFTRANFIPLYGVHFIFLIFVVYGILFRCETRLPSAKAKEEKVLIKRLD